MKTRNRLLPGSAGLVALILLATGCEIDSSETSGRDVDIDVSGYYSGSLSGRLVEQNSGAPITGLDLRQSGDSLEGYDNNGKIFHGTIGQASGTRASITLEGDTTAGAAGVISGYIDVNGTSATMSGTWLEDAVSSRVAGTATVPEPQSDVTISPSSAALNSDGDTQNFTASGGDGSYSWTLSDSSLGSVSSGSGSSITYTRSSSGSNTITVNSGGDSASASISQP